MRRLLKDETKDNIRKGYRRKKHRIISEKVKEGGSNKKG